VSKGRRGCADLAGRGSGCRVRRLCERGIVLSGVVVVFVVIRGSCLPLVVFGRRVVRGVTLLHAGGAGLPGPSTIPPQGGTFALDDRRSEKDFVVPIPAAFKDTVELQ
jgi:hypothetical protein